MQDKNLTAKPSIAYGLKMKLANSYAVSFISLPFL